MCIRDRNLEVLREWALRMPAETAKNRPGMTLGTTITTEGPLKGKTFGHVLTAALLLAFAQDDIKKVLAYSTVSQLGFMFMGVGVGVFWAAALHLVTHACFKACLFLGAGSVMHGNGDETDIKRLGGLRKEMPWTLSLIHISEPTRLLSISYAVFCLKKKKKE